MSTIPARGEPIGERFLPEAAETVRKAIDEAGGCEVCFAGMLDGDGRVATLRVTARGHGSAVPASFDGLRLGEAVIHNHPSGDLTPSDADLDLAVLYQANGHPMFIVDNAATLVYTVIEPQPAAANAPLEASELASLIAPDGVLAKVLPHYEWRPQQQDMLEAIAEAFNRDTLGVVEAPTGVGKSLAYLLPAALWAKRNRERVVIATRTINLQEQLIDNDIPLLQRILDEAPRACLVKGRRNYVCWRKLERAMGEATLFADDAEQQQLKDLSDWADTTSDGSLSDLPFVPARGLWDRVCSEADTCPISRCPNPKRCFVTRARRDVAAADLIVTNHSLLFSDLSIKHQSGSASALGVLPNFRRLIIDEAHHVEDSATEYFGVSATRIGTRTAFSRIFRSDRGQARGLMPMLQVRLIRECQGLDVPEYDAIVDLMEKRFLPALDDARQATEGAFAQLRELVADACGQVGRDVKWRITQAVLERRDYQGVYSDYVQPAIDTLALCVTYGHRLLDRLKSVPPNEGERESPLATEVQLLAAYLQRIERASQALQETLGPESPENSVRWIEIDAGNADIVRVLRCPIHTGKELAEAVYPRLATGVMTSATLAVRGSFDYFRHRTGLDHLTDQEVAYAQIESPFDFERQALLGVPTDLPWPDDPAFRAESAGFVTELATIMRGRMLVLFTSYAALDGAARTLGRRLQSEGIEVLRQGQETRSELLRRFRKGGNSILLATDSFWEGVDIPGEALECVVLTKLPFRVPSDPILEARAEAIEAAGGNAFFDFSVPQAVTKFRQGFGRLIRRRTDRGAVIVLDRRLVSRSYGRAFLESLPPLRTVRDSSVAVLDAVSRFFEHDPT